MKAGQLLQERFRLVPSTYGTWLNASEVTALEVSQRLLPEMRLAGTKAALGRSLALSNYRCAASNVAA